MDSLNDSKEQIILHLADVYVDRGLWDIDYSTIDNAHAYTIAEAIGLNRRTVAHHLEELENDGLISHVEQNRDGRVRKVFDLTDSGWNMVEVLYS